MQKTTVRLIGYEKVTKHLGVLGTNIDKEFNKMTQKELEHLREKMKKIINSWNTSGRTGRTVRGLVISPSVKTGTGYRTSLRSTAPWSQKLEYGTKEGWLNVTTKPDLHKWAEANYRPIHVTSSGKGWVHVGGPDSNIQLGRSNRKFFFNTIDKYTKDKRFTRESKIALDKGIKKSMR